MSKKILASIALISTVTVVYNVVKLVDVQCLANTATKQLFFCSIEQ